MKIPVSALLLFAGLAFSQNSVFDKPLKILRYGDSFGAFAGAVNTVVNENFSAMKPIRGGGHASNGWMVTQNYNTWWPIAKDSFPFFRPDWLFFQDAGRDDPDFEVTMARWVPEAVDSGLKVIISDNPIEFPWYTAQPGTYAAWQLDNAAAKQIADQYGTVFLPLHQIGAEIGVRLGWATLLPDQLHPTAHFSLFAAIALVKAWGGNVNTLTFATTGCPAETTAVFVRVVDSVMNAFDRFYVKTQNGIAFQSATENIPEWTEKQLSVYAVYADTAGAKFFNNRIDWRSTNTAVATVTPRGIVRGVSPGAASIIVTYDNFADTLAVTVTANVSALDSIVLSAATTTMMVGDTVPVWCTAWYSDGGRRDVTNEVATYSEMPLIGRAGFVAGLDTGASDVVVYFENKTDTLRFMVTPRLTALTLVDFGFSAQSDAFGVQGWDWVLNDVGTSYSLVRPYGMVVFEGPVYNYQGASGTPLYFATGDKIRVRWKNLTATPLSFTPRVSFDDPNRPDAAPAGTWMNMSAANIPPQAETITEYVVDNAHAGLKTLVNTNMGSANTMAVLCDRIELVRAGLSILPPLASLDSMRIISPRDTMVEGDSLSIDVLGFYQTHIAVVTGEAEWFSGASGGLLRALAPGNVTVTASLGGKSASLDMVVLARPAFIRRINFSSQATPFKNGWLADNGGAYSGTQGYGWTSGAGFMIRDDRAGYSFLLKSFVGPGTGTSAYKIDAPDGDYLIRIAMGDNAYGSGVMNCVVSGTDTLIKYVGGSSYYSDTSRGILGLINGIATTTVHASGGAINLTVQGYLNYLVICSAAEGTPLKFIADDVGSPGTAVGNLEKEMPATVPETMSLSAYPNPFNPSTNMVVRGCREQVLFSIFDLQGRLVWQQEVQASGGQVKSAWNAESIPSGIYFLRAQSAGTSFSGKLVLTR